MTPRTLGRLEWWLDSNWSVGVWRCDCGPYKWFAFVGPLCVFYMRPLAGGGEEKR